MASPTARSLLRVRSKPCVVLIFSFYVRARFANLFPVYEFNRLQEWNLVGLPYGDSEPAESAADIEGGRSWREGFSDIEDDDDQVISLMSFPRSRLSDLLSELVSCAIGANVL